MFFSKMKIGTKLISIFLLTGLVPLGILGFISLSKSQSALEHAEFNQLESIRQIKRLQIESYFAERLGDVSVLSSNPTVVEAMEAFDQAFTFGVDSDQYKQVNSAYSDWLTQYEKEYGYYDLFLINTDGDIVYTVEREPDFATNLVSGRFSNQNIAALFHRAKNEVVLQDFAAYAPSNGVAASFVGAPVKKDGKTIGVAALQLSIAAINKIMQERSGLGESGETYLVGDDLLMRSDSRFSTKSTILEQTCDHASIKSGLTGKSGIEVVPDYRGINVLSAYAPLELPGLNWTIIAEIDEEEAYHAVATLRSFIFLLIGVIAVIVAAVGWFFSRSISRPIARVAMVASSVAQGDVNHKIEVRSQDEIGQLGRSFEELIDYMKEMAGAAESIARNDLTASITPRSEDDALGNAFKMMIDNLSGVLNQLNDSVQQLVTASNEISSSSEQMATGSRSQTDQANQVTSAIQEMTATILESSKNANEAREVSEQTSAKSGEGQRVVGDTISGMVRIADSASESGRIISDLAEASDKIGEIIAVIDDIADQTNLLALNAAIEAARAGEQGRGFAVVADEVRKLAERTGTATGEITDMIKGIQEDSGRAVTSMEGASKLVDEGKALADEAGNSLNEINQMSTRVSDMIIQIATAADQQSAAAEQISHSMEQIANVTRESAAGAEQSASAAENLNQQAEVLKTMIGQFKVRTKATV